MVYRLGATTQKSKKSIRNKVIRKHAEGRTDYSVLEMKDHARSKVYVNDWNEIPQVLEYLRDHGIKYETEAIGPTPYGYKGFHVTWRNGDGLGAELQITMPDVWQVKLKSDAIYDKWRDVNVEDLTAESYRQYKKDIAQSKRMWDNAHLPDFSIWASSDSDNTRPSMIVPNVTDRAGTHLPSSSSLIGNDESSNIRPSSVSTNIGEPPFDGSTNIVPQNEDGSNTRFSLRTPTLSNRDLLRHVAEDLDGIAVEAGFTEGQSLKGDGKWCIV